MRIGEVFDVDVVTHRGAVRSRPVIAKDHNLVAVTERNLQYQWDEVSFHLTVFSKTAPGTRHIEITQAGSADVVCLGVRGDGVVHGQLGGTVRVGRRGWHVFGNWCLLWLAVGCSCRREHQVIRTGITHRVE